ncbi:MAG: hypothetical protein HQL15_06565, partial [Candidatus Omnitrophica bacterium]|nr:hypothetical protein [Candidatus Omnitrophota bacterium]
KQLQEIKDGAVKAVIMGTLGFFIKSVMYIAMTIIFLRNRPELFCLSILFGILYSLIGIISFLPMVGCAFVDAKTFEKEDYELPRKIEAFCDSILMINPGCLGVFGGEWSMLARVSLWPMAVAVDRAFGRGADQFSQEEREYIFETLERLEELCPDELKALAVISGMMVQGHIENHGKDDFVFKREVRDFHMAQKRALSQEMAGRQAPLVFFIPSPTDSWTSYAVRLGVVIIAVYMIQYLMMHAPPMIKSIRSSLQ